MPFEIIRHNEKLLKEEKHLIKFGREAMFNVCLVYPNTYFVGMSNLGFQVIYKQINSSPNFFCDRAFYPDPGILELYKKSKRKLMSLLTERPLQEFDIIALSISYETDYINMPEILELAGIPPLSKDRDNSHPLIIAGGTAVSINPEVIADFVDIFVIGEGEQPLEQLLSLFSNNSGGNKNELMLKSAGIPSVYVPSLYEVKYDDEGFIQDVKCRHDVEYPVKRSILKQVSGDVHSYILTGNTEFPDTFLIEVSRGCPFSCKFCCVNLNKPYRYVKVEKIFKSIDLGLSLTKRIGLLGAAVGSHPDLKEILHYIERKKGNVSFSSVRADVLEPEIVELFYRLGQRTITIAPEVGSDRLRHSINKTMKNRDVLHLADCALDIGFREIRVYFMVGLPGEIDEDIQESIDLLSSLKSLAKVRGGKIVVSLNQFIPKPGTSFENEPLSSSRKVSGRIKKLKKPFARDKIVEFRVESLKEMFLQAFLSRGSRKFSKYVLENYGISISAIAKNIKRLEDPSIDSLVYSVIPTDKIPPWKIIAGLT